MPTELPIRLPKGDILLYKSVRNIDLFDCNNQYISALFQNREYPWDILKALKGYMEELISIGMEGFREIQQGVFVGEDVKIHPNVVIQAPAIIGKGSEIRPGAFLRGYVLVGENCVIGNSTEIKHSVLLNNVQVPHYNYVGDSVLGNHAHMGAGAVCSNLKADGKQVVVHAEKDYETHLRKVGAILGDNADVGCGCILNPGTIIGKKTTVYPLTCVRGVMPANAIVKGLDNIVKRI